LNKLWEIIKNKISPRTGPTPGTDHNFQVQLNSRLSYQYKYSQHISCIPVYISVRDKVAKDILSFAVPYKMFREMENNVEGSFLEQEPWTKNKGTDR